MCGELFDVLNPASNLLAIKAPIWIFAAGAIADEVFFYFRANAVEFNGV